MKPDDGLPVGDVKERASRMRANGASFAKIAEALGVGKTTVQEWLKPGGRNIGRMVAIDRSDG